MCGRITITIDSRKYSDFCKTILDAEPSAHDSVDIPSQRYNIVPSSSVGIIYSDGARLTHRVCTWWILPPFAVDDVKFVSRRNATVSFSWLTSSHKSHFNSRFDTITNPKNRYWHSLLKRKRCVIVADGFYEWPDKKMAGKDNPGYPWYFRLKDHRPFCFAGLWECVADKEGKEFYSTNIITVEPNELLRSLPHHRMPAILRDDEVRKWLSAEISLDEVVQCLHPTPGCDMEGYPVEKLINYPHNDSPECIIPRAAGARLTQR